jgi:hypothetical protein
MTVDKIVYSATVRPILTAFIVLVLPAFNTAWAQPIKCQVSPETATLVKNRKLVVLLRSEDQGVIKKIGGAGAEELQTRH